MGSAFGHFPFLVVTSVLSLRSGLKLQFCEKFALTEPELHLF